MKYCIGDTVVCINVEEQNLHSNFQAFRCDESEEPQLTIDIVEEPEMTMNIQMTVGQIMLMESEEIGVFEGAMGIDLLYPKNVQLTSIAIAKGYRSAKVYVVQDAEGKWKEELFLALRDVIYLALEQNGRFVLDSSSLLVDGRGVILAADPNAEFAGICQGKQIGKILNDSANIIGIYKERLYLYGTPWCSPGAVQAERAPLGGIVFLKKSDAGAVTDLPEDKRQLLMLVHCKSPFWREGLLDQCLNTIQRVEPSVWIRQLESHADEAAADVLKPALDTIENDTVAEY